MNASVYDLIFKKLFLEDRETMIRQIHELAKEDVKKCLVSVSKDPNFVRQAVEELKQERELEKMGKLPTNNNKSAINDNLQPQIQQNLPVDQRKKPISLNDNSKKPILKKPVPIVRKNSSSGSGNVSKKASPRPNPSTNNEETTPRSARSQAGGSKVQAPKQVIEDQEKKDKKLKPADEEKKRRLQNLMEQFLKQKIDEKNNQKNNIIPEEKKNSSSIDEIPSKEGTPSIPKPEKPSKKQEDQTTKPKTPKTSARTPKIEQIAEKPINSLKSSTEITKVEGMLQNFEEQMSEIEKRFQNRKTGKIELRRNTQRKELASDFKKFETDMKENIVQVENELKKDKKRKEEIRKFPSRTLLVMEQGRTGLTEVSQISVIERISEILFEDLIDECGEELKNVTESLASSVYSQEFKV